MNNSYIVHRVDSEDELYHYRTKGSKNGVRRYQNLDGTLTEAGKVKAKAQNWWNGPPVEKAKKAVADTITKYKVKRTEKSAERQKQLKSLNRKIKIERNKRLAAEEKRKIADREEAKRKEEEAKRKAEEEKAAEEKLKADAEARKREADRKEAERAKNKAEADAYKKPVSEMSNAELQAAINRLNKEKEYKAALVAAGQAKTESVLQQQAKVLISEAAKTVALTAGKELGNYILKSTKEAMAKAEANSNEGKAKQKAAEEKKTKMLKAITSTNAADVNEWLKTASEEDIKKASGIMQNINTIRSDYILKTTNETMAKAKQKATEEKRTKMLKAITSTNKADVDEWLKTASEEDIKKASSIIQNINTITSKKK